MKPEAIATRFSGTGEYPRIERDSPAIVRKENKRDVKRQQNVRTLKNRYRL